jgi:POT family proton-dependent oligopeptide transporter
MSQTPQSSTAADEWFGQPRGLSVLFLTETWTQFSFFGMRALLVYYVTKELKIGQEDASLIYGGYAAAVYFTPIIGGVLADRFLGKTNAVILGGLLMAAGHFMMAFESLFYPALAAIAIGNGFFLPSLSGQVSQLYRENDPRLASAYNIYYVGINLGAFLAPIVCGWLGETYGWHWGFVAAGVGMLLALVIYLAGRRYLPQDSLAAEKAAEAVAPHGPERTQRFLLLAGIMLVVVIFRGAYEQNGNTIALWTDSGIDRHLSANSVIPLTWFQSINPLLIFLFTPLLVAHWTRQARQGREPSSIAKMATGAAITAVCYLVTAGAAAWSAASGDRASWLWVALYFLLLTLGELFILPVGLGLFGRAAPRGYGATAIAIWFFAGFAGNLFAGVLGVLWSEIPHAWFFALIAAVAALSGLMLLPFRAAVMRAEHPSANEAADTGAVAAPAG